MSHNRRRSRPPPADNELKRTVMTIVVQGAIRGVLTFLIDLWHGGHL